MFALYVCNLPRSKESGTVVDPWTMMIHLQDADSSAAGRIHVFKCINPPLDYLFCFDL